MATQDEALTVAATGPQKFLDFCITHVKLKLLFEGENTTEA